MMVTQIGDSLIEEYFKFAQNKILTPANLGILKKGTRQDLIDRLKEFDINALINIGSREEYNEWFDKEVMEFHVDMLPLYRDNLVIDKDNPYTYSARLLTNYLKVICTRTPVFYYDGDNYMQMVHPIISNKFLRLYPKFGIKQVNEITSREEYYEIVEYYHYLMGIDLCEENKGILELDFGMEV